MDPKESDKYVTKIKQANAQNKSANKSGSTS
jgi:hypothetical protein